MSILRRNPMRRAILALALATGCRATAASPASSAASDTGHLSPAEQRTLEAIRRIHEPGVGLIQRLRESGLLADSVEWWVAGPSEVLPFAGTWRGLAGIAEFQRRLGATMRYDTAAVREYLVSGDQVAAIFLGTGVSRQTGKPFRSDIVRLYTFREGRIVRVRNYYDTDSYVRAVQGKP